MNVLRSLVGIIAGMAVISIVIQALEFTLVNAMAPSPITDMASYFAVRNRPGVLTMMFVSSAMAGLLGGYVTARIASAREIQHGIIVAAIQTAVLIWGFARGEFAFYTPLWARVMFVALTGPTMIVGAAIRGRAARFSTRAP
jgi:hypothetical protein